MEFFKFFGVGAISTLVDWSVFYFLLQLSLYHHAALIIAFICGGVVNFFANKRYTFKNSSKRVKKQMLVFFSIAAFALLASMALLFVAVDVLSFPPFLSRAAITGVIFIFNFFAHKRITFSKLFS